MSWKIRTLALFMGLNLLPTLAAGETVSETPPRALVDLTKSEIEQTFRNFSAGEIRGTRQARLYGSVFSECRQHFTITVTSRGNTRTGWRIQDTGDAGRRCMRDRQNETCTDTTCESLSTWAPVISAPNAETVEIGVVNIDPDRDINDPNRVAFTSLTPKIEFRSMVAAVHDELAQIEERDRRRIVRLREQVRTCRNNEEQLGIAREALRILVAEGDVRESNMSRILRELDRKELSLLQREISRARVDQLASLSDRVMEFANSRARSNDRYEERGSDYATAAANLMRTIAQKYVRDRNADEDSFADARDVLEKALELEGLSDTNVTRLEGYLDDLEVAETAFLCRTGDAFECTPAYNSMMQNLAHRAREACNGWNVDQARCQTAMMQLQRAPGQIQQVFAQRQQMQRQFAGGGAALPGQQAQFGNPMGYQQNPFLTQSAMALNPMGGLPGAGYNPTAALVMNGSGGVMMPGAPPMQLPVASI